MKLYLKGLRRSPHYDYCTAQRTCRPVLRAPFANQTLYFPTPFFLIQPVQCSEKLVGK